MIRSAWTAWAAAACLMVTGGCRSAGWGSPLGFFRKDPAEQTAKADAESEEEAAEQLADSGSKGKGEKKDAKAGDSAEGQDIADAIASASEESSPFRRRPFRNMERLIAEEQAAASRDSASSAERHAESALGEWQPAPRDSRGDLFADSQLQQQIDRELQLTDPSEREELRSTFASLDPAVARQIIKVRQMARSMGRRDLLAEGGPSPATRNLPADDWQPAPADSRRLFGHSSGSFSGNQAAAAPAPAQSDRVVRLVGGPRDFSSRSSYDQFQPHESGSRQLPLDDATALYESGSLSGTLYPSRNDTSQQSAALDSAFRDQPTAGYRPSAGPLGRSQYSAHASRGNREMPSSFPTSAAGLGVSGAMHSDLDRLISLAEADAAQTRIGTTEAERQQYIEKQVYLRMLYLMDGRTNYALEPIHGLDPSHQEFWTQILWSMANYFDSERMPEEADRITQTVAQLTPAVRSLRAQADLQLRNVTFCHRISSFGNYSRFPSDVFQPGQRVLVYAEVQNFRSEPMVDGQFRTVLRSQIEILRPGPNGGLVAEPIRFAPTEDLCRNQREDYFHSYEFTVPQGIAYGPHVMRITVYDELSGKVATSTVNFTVR